MANPISLWGEELAASPQERWAESLVRELLSWKEYVRCLERELERVMLSYRETEPAAADSSDDVELDEDYGM